MLRLALEVLGTVTGTVDVEELFVFAVADAVDVLARDDVRSWLNRVMGGPIRMANEDGREFWIDEPGDN